MHDETTARLRGPVFDVNMESVGARISSIIHRETSLELLATHISALPQSKLSPSEADWQQRFAAGWNVLIPNAGDEREIAGTHHPYHGEAARRSWSILRQQHSITATVELRSLPLVLTRMVRFSGAALIVDQEVRNISNLSQSFAWVEHPVFDTALFDVSNGIHLADTVVPAAPLGRASFHSTPVTSGMLRVPLSTRPLDLQLAWDPLVLPHVHVWQERGSSAGAPWFGRVDGVAFEPASHGPGPYQDGLGPLVVDARSSIKASLHLQLANSDVCLDNPGRVAGG